MKYFLILILSFFLVSCDQGINPNNPNPNNTHGVIGLNNDTGFYCYLNAVIQALSNLSPKSNFLESENLSAPEQIMKNILSEYKNKQKTEKYSQKMRDYKKQFVKLIFSNDKVTKQNCAMEVLGLLSPYTSANEIIFDFHGNLNNLDQLNYIDTQKETSSNDNLYIIQLHRTDLQNPINKNVTPMPIDLEITRDSKKYRLSSVLIHIGQHTNFGHYTALLIKVNEAFYCNDKHISNGNQILNNIVQKGNTGNLYETPLILFYEKVFY